MMKRIAMLLCACLLLALMPTALADEVVSPEVERAAEVQEFDLTGEADAGEADIAAAEWNEEEVLVPKSSDHDPDLLYGGGKVIGKVRSDGILEITEAIDYFDVDEYHPIAGGYVEIRYEAMAGNKKLKGIELADDIRYVEIESRAFKGCTNLKKLEFSKDVSISTLDEAFAGCTGLESVIIKGEASFGESAFKGCTGLKKLVIGEGSSGVWHTNFDGCTALKDVTLPKSVEVLGYNCFSGTGIESIDLPDGVLIGDEAFAASKLKSIVIPKGAEVRDNAFWRCRQLKRVTFLDKDSYIRDNAFVESTKDDVMGMGDIEGDKWKHSCPDDMVICGYVGSTAEAYAKKFNYTFEPLVKVTKVKLNKTGTQTLKLGKTLKLKATVSPANANYDAAVTWKSSDKKVAKVSSKGVVTPLKKGTVKITATAGGKSKTIKVKVTAPKPTKVTLYKGSTKLKSGKKLTLKKGKTLKLKTKLTPKEAETTLTWKSSDKKVATVSKSGKVKAVGKGTATITVKTKNGKKAKVKIKVK